MIVAAVGIVYQDAGIARPLGYAIAGYLVPAAVVTGIVWYGLAPAAGLDAAFCNGVSMVAGTFGAACAVAAMAPLRTYAREFADGYVSVIQVAASSTAARSLDKYLDPTWKPPADRVRDASDARDIREAMKRRDV